MSQALRMNAYKNLVFCTIRHAKHARELLRGIVALTSICVCRYILYESWAVELDDKGTSEYTGCPRGNDCFFQAPLTDPINIPDCMNIPDLTNVPDPTNVRVSESPVSPSGRNQFRSAFETCNCTSLPAAEEHAPPLPEQHAMQSNGTMDTPRQRPQR